MADVDFLHHENPPTWAEVKPATLGAEGQRQINHLTQPAPRTVFSMDFLVKRSPHLPLSFHYEPLPDRFLSATDPVSRNRCAKSVIIDAFGAVSPGYFC
ncbi:hypothetical protein TNCV_3534231 [Trichonephila clavipes]|nr:hypothetical protein TNCV_3534231 [Trichonephila clavipes]